MKKNVLTVLLSLFVVVAFSQTRQQVRALADIEAEIIQLQKQLVDASGPQERIKMINVRLSELYIDPVVETGLKDRLTKENKALAIALIHNEPILVRIKELEGQKLAIKNLIANQAIMDKTPKELRSLEKKRRKNSLEVRQGELLLDKQELALQKLQETPVLTDGNKGYKVILWNQNVRKYVNIKITDASGLAIDDPSHYLFPGQKDIIYLLPGKYEYIIEMPGEFDQKDSFTVGITKKKVGDEYCHAYVIQPRR
ncbi:MAG: hypothetical protein RBT30_00860 [Patescibacteria group bacterium]|jgi:hypothetical protein|nr:hypothetical protein [Patescibacteria group bacterium]